MTWVTDVKGLVTATAAAAGEPAGAFIKDSWGPFIAFLIGLWQSIGTWLTVRLTWLTYKIAENLPVVQIITLGTQWGDDLKNLYFLFARQKYWGKPLPQLYCLEVAGK